MHCGFKILTTATTTCIAILALTGCRKQPDTPYAGSVSCRECHAKFYDLWAPSHHGKAMQPVTAAFVAEALTPQPEPIAVGSSTFMADLPGMQVWETGPEGRKAYAMVHAMGGKNVYYFLTPMDRGRLQVLPIAYKVDEHEWYNTTASMVRHAIGDDEPVDWTDPLLTFNTECFNCHVSQLEKNYDVATDTYHTEWREPGINCEACHGPSAEHVRVCREAGRGKVPKDLKTLKWSDFTHHQVNDACATCHAKAAQITPGFMPGERFFDHYTLATLEDRDFYPDGRDLGENYTHTGWLMNPCARASTLDCDHCHTSSGRFRQKDNPNQACLPCHAERVKNATAHTHHPAGSRGNECIGCHMPLTRFSHMRRSDHSMRPPVPEATLAFGSPNACSICHGKDDAAFRAKTLATRFPQRPWRDRIMHEGALVQAARSEDWKRLPDMLAAIADPASDPVLVTSLLRLTAPCPHPTKWNGIREALQHDSPLVRSAAADSLHDDIANPATLRALIDATADDYRVVRIRAASSLARHPLNRLTVEDRTQVEAASAELMTSFTARPDHWSSYYNLGNYHGNRGRTAEAMDAYRQAIRLRGDMLPPLVNAAVTAAQLGHTADGIPYLEQAYAIAPTNGAVNFNLGLAYAETGKQDAAIKHLRIAMRSERGRPATAYNLAVLMAPRNTARAIELCGIAAAGDPGNPRYAYTQAYYQVNADQPADAITTLKGVITRHPGYADAWVLLGDLFVKSGQSDQARQHFAAMRDEKALPINLRTQARRRLADLAPDA